MLGTLLFAGGERGSRNSQISLNVLCERVRDSEDASRGRFRVLERRHGLAEIVERGADLIAERIRESLMDSTTRLNWTYFLPRNWLLKH